MSLGEVSLCGVSWRRHRLKFSVIAIALLIFQLNWLLVKNLSVCASASVCFSEGSTLLNCFFLFLFCNLKIRIGEVCFIFGLGKEGMYSQNFI